MVERGTVVPPVDVPEIPVIPVAEETRVAVAAVVVVEINFPTLIALKFKEAQYPFGFSIFNASNTWSNPFVS